MVYFLQCLLATLACPVIMCYSVCPGLVYIYLKIWTVIIFDVVLVCINARIFQHFMLGTVFRRCILVKNCHLGFKKAPVDSTSVASLKF